MRRRSRSGRVTLPSSIRNVPSRVTAGDQRLLGPHHVRVPERASRRCRARPRTQSSASSRAPPPASTRFVGVGPARVSARGERVAGGWPSPARAALRMSWTTAWATPSWISGSGAFWVALGVERARERARSRGRVGEVDRRRGDQRRPTSPDQALRAPPRDARPLKAVSPEQVEQPAHRLGLEDDRVLARQEAPRARRRKPP